MSTSCDAPSSPAPSKPVPQVAAEEIEVDARYEGFAFAPTLSRYRPADADLIPIAEMGDATQRSMKAVVAFQADGPLQLALWRFELAGEKETLAPLGPPTPLLALEASQSSDADALDALRVQMAAPRSVVTRPQGFEVETPDAALAELHALALQIRGARTSRADRLAALARFARGLDDDLLFSSRGLQHAIEALLVPPQTTTEPSTSKRRATLRRPDGTRFAMFDKRDGWVLAEIEPGA